MVKNGKEIFPLSNISNSNIVYCNENGVRVIYKSNKYGFRSKGYEVENQNFTNTIFVIGDSYTQGACVQEGYTIEDQLRIKFPNYNIKSFGKGGTSLLYQYAIFKEYILHEIKSFDSLFIFHYPINDFLEVYTERKINYLRNYFEIENFSQNLKNSINNSNKDSLLKEYISKNFKKKSKDKNYILKNLKIENLANYVFKIIWKSILKKEVLFMENYLIKF